jgi:ATP-binding cassette subfamily A (ABC1) protein 3
MIENGFFSFLKKNPPKLGETDRNEEDPDIKAETDRVNDEKTSDDPVRVKNLRKVFHATTKKGKPVIAVDRVSFGLEYGECFALLGVSGAGKTTTFKCLTGEENPSEGLASILGNDLAKKHGFEKARKMIGYCP